MWRWWVRVNTMLPYSSMLWKRETEKKRLPEMECSCVCECARVYISKRQATNCNKISMYNNEFVCLHCIGIGMFECVRACLYFWCCILYNNGINIRFTFIHYWMPTTKMKLSGNALWQKSHPSRLYSMVGFKCQCVCIKNANTGNDDDGSCNSSGMVVFGAGKSTVRLSNCQTIHMHIGSSVSMPGNSINRERCKGRQKKNPTLRIIYIKLLLLLLGFFGYISERHELNIVNKREPKKMGVIFFRW